MVDIHDRLFSFIVEARRMHGRLLAQIDIYIVAKPGTIDREIKRVGEREGEKSLPVRVMGTQRGCVHVLTVMQVAVGRGRAI